MIILFDDTAIACRGPKQLKEIMTEISQIMVD